MSDKPPSWVDDQFSPVREDEVRDENPSVLVRRLDRLTLEVHNGFDSMSRQLMPAINRIQDALEDIAVRLARLERDRDDHRNRLVAIEQKLEKSAKARRARK